MIAARNKGRTAVVALLCAHKARLRLRAWFRLWRITNYWWRVAGVGQHAEGAPGRKRNREAYEADCEADANNAEYADRSEISMTMSRRHAIVSAFADAARDVGQERVVENMRPYRCETSYKNNMLRLDLMKIREKRRRKGCFRGAL